jgi:hypothetical protein
MRKTTNFFFIFIGLYLFFTLACKKSSDNNSQPAATNVNITGSAEVNDTLTATYTFADADGDLEQGSTFQWYVMDDASGLNEAPISGATTLTYIIQEAQEDKYIRFGITPKAATGINVGTEVKSNVSGPVGAATSVKFMYNGAEVTYGIITSAKTGEKWLDRNLGASRMAQSLTDYQAYGDLFEWGRLADGHQLISRTGPSDEEATGVTGTTSTTSSADVPSTDEFILNVNSPYDWRIPQENNLWQGVNGVNNPCPSGWRLPTTNEWTAEEITGGADAFSKLKLTLAGQRVNDDGRIVISGVGVEYWTSTVDGIYTQSLYLDATSMYIPDVIYRAGGNPCRCIKD